MIEPRGSTVTVDLLEKAQRMTEAAVAVTTGRMKFDSPRSTRAALARGDEQAVSYFRHELGRQVASALLMMDPHVEAVFEDHDVPESEEEIPPASTLSDPLRLFVRVGSEMPAIAALIRALGDSLAHALGEALPQRPHGLLEATIISDADSRLLRARARGFRPAPVLLASREDVRLSDLSL